MKKGIKLHLLNKNKYKTNLIAIFLTTELTRDNVTYNALLTSVLRRGCEKFKTQDEISKQLEEMYGATFDCGVSKIGKNHVLKFYIETINDEFIPGGKENIFKKSIDIITEIIFNTLVEENGLKEEYMLQEKQNVKQIIEAKKDNKASYSYFRCIEEMYKGETEGLYKYGYVEDLEKIDRIKLYNYYKDLIKNSKIDIFISGKIDNIGEEEISYIKQKLENIQGRDSKYIVNKLNKKSTKEKEEYVEESMDVNQGKLVIGYDIKMDEEITENENTRYIGMVYNGILGGSANSKLFQNVREKESLAYTTNSSYSYLTGNILVSAGIEIENYKKTVSIIKKQIEDMANGKFDDEDIENTKKTIISNIETIEDEQDTEIIYFLGQELNGKNVTLEKYIEKIKNVKKEQIEDFAKRVKINTIYFLRD